MFQYFHFTYKTNSSVKALGTSVHLMSIFLSIHDVSSFVYQQYQFQPYMCKLKINPAYDSFETGLPMTIQYSVYTHIVTVQININMS